MISRRIEWHSRVNLAVEDTRGETANCESGIIRARDLLLTIFLSFSFFLVLFFCVHSSLSPISFLLHSVLFPFSVSSFIFRVRFFQSFSLSRMSRSLSLSFAPTSSRGVSVCSIGSWAGTHTGGGGGLSPSSREFEPHARARATHATTHLPNQTELQIVSLVKGSFTFWRPPVEKL